MNWSIFVRTAPSNLGRLFIGMLVLSKNYLYTHTILYLNMMTIHVVRGVSEEAIHDKALRVNAVNQRVRRLDTHTHKKNIYK